jgi:hypothetical protein
MSIQDSVPFGLLLTNVNGLPSSQMLGQAGSSPEDHLLQPGASHIGDQLGWRRRRLPQAWFICR